MPDLLFRCSVCGNDIIDGNCSCGNITTVPLPSKQEARPGQAISAAPGLTCAEQRSSEAWGQGAGMLAAERNADASPPTCGRVKADCVCDQDVGHDGPCICECGGAWDGQYIVRFPGGGFGDLLADFLPVPQPGARFRMTGPRDWEPIAAPQCHCHHASIFGHETSCPDYVARLTTW